ncbi:MAG: glycoside hydrolase family 2 TIM barrel-domain containing protein [Verrucomicrobiota bacterium]
MRTVLLFLTTALFLSTSGFARESSLLDTGWKFKQGEITGAAEPDFDDAGWSSLTVPHCWGWEEAQQGKDFYKGPGWYRRELIVMPKQGQRHFLRFEAASTVADVYLNGRRLGGHRGGFGAFSLEITSHLAADGKNQLAVRVSNKPEADIAPLSGDFSVYGGLYRPVHLLVTGEQNFSPTDHGSSGVAWLQTSVSAEQAVLDVTLQISDAAKKSRKLTLVAVVRDANGNQVASSEREISTAQGKTAPYELRVTVPDPHLWNGIKDPYLYQSVVELRTAGGDVVDTVTEPLGLRYYSVDPEKGFFLNGQPYHLHGVNKHQDRIDKGWALNETDLDEDVALLKEIGATVVRGAHYQHSDYFHSQCDRAGILVWAEIPLVNRVTDSPEFAQTSRDQLLDLIRQNINHPSIFTWGIFNEMDPGKADPFRILQDLRNTAHGEDPTRPVIAATNRGEWPALNKISDLLGWNIYPGWYGGQASDYGAVIDRRRTDGRSGGIAISEYGAGANVTQHEDHPRPPETRGQWHPEEYQSITHEAAWAAMKTRPYIWGTFVWCLTDFTAAGRNEGGTPGRNDKGLVTYDHKIRKDAFYFYKANWSSAPVLHITSRRFTERTQAVTDVKIYSNAAKAECLHNGVSLGPRDNDGNGVFIWKDVTLTPGENRIQARAERAGQRLSDECIWKLNP